MRISDWSSDVCSSDLSIALPAVRAAGAKDRARMTGCGHEVAVPVSDASGGHHAAVAALGADGRAGFQPAAGCAIAAGRFSNDFSLREPAGGQSGNNGVERDKYVGGMGRAYLGYDVY